MTRHTFVGKTLVRVNHVTTACESIQATDGGERSAPHARQSSRYTTTVIFNTQSCVRHIKPYK